MGRLPALVILSIFILAFDYYCFKAILGVFKTWKQNTRRFFAIAWWSYSILLIIGVFVSILNVELTATLSLSTSIPPLVRE